MGLLGWALIFAEDSPGGLSPNNEPREARVEPRVAPIFSLQSLDGTGLIDTNRFEGRVVMIDFWSSWCPPCRAEAAGLQEVYEEYSDSPVEFIGIAIWDYVDDVKAHISEFDITYPNAIDDSGKTVIQYGVLGIPEKFFVDPSGRIVRKYVGPIGPDTLRSILDELLDGA